MASWEEHSQQVEGEGEEEEGVGLHLEGEVEGVQLLLLEGVGLHLEEEVEGHPLEAEEEGVELLLVVVLEVVWSHLEGEGEVQKSAPQGEGVVEGELLEQFLLAQKQLALQLAL